MHKTARLTAGEIADLVGGVLVGDDQITIAGVAPLDGAGPGDLSFLVTARYLNAFRNSAAGVVLLLPRFRDEAGGPTTRIVVDSPYLALSRVLPKFNTTPPVPWGVHPTASVGSGSRWSGRVALGAGVVIGRDVVLGADCVIGPHCTIGDGVRLGDGCRLDAHAGVEGGARLGHRVVLCAGARVGTPGFGYAEGAAGHDRIHHVGGCFVGDDVEIGANSTVDRGGVADTVIGSGTKIDNLVQVGHNVQVGERCLIMAQVGLAGSTIVEDDVILAGQAGLAGHLTIGRGAKVAAQSGVIGDVPPAAVVSGYPARSHRDVLRQAAALKRLTPLVTRLEQLAAGDDDPR